ncbi:MAG: enoyl-[acyl-carrier-protein] reductase [Victivallaceae bacterium]
MSNQMLSLDLKGKKVFIAGIGDDQGYGWGIAKSLASAGAVVLVGTWVPILKIFKQSFEMGKFDESRKLSDGSLMNFAKIYPLDASFDVPEDIPEEVKENKRYKEVAGYTIQEVADAVKTDFSSIDYLVHSLANAPEVTKSLLDTSRKGYLSALSNSSYSFVSLVSRFGPLMSKGGGALSLTYEASQKAVPGYGGGMNAAKAALESDTRFLAWEAGRRWSIRINTISAGPIKSRAGKAIGFIDKMVDYSLGMSPIQTPMTADQVGNVAAFLLSPLSEAINGSVLYVDHGVHMMGVSPEMLR